MTVRSLEFVTPLLRRAPRRDPAIRLLCAPHAGAGASYFAGWAERLPGDVELVAMQLPGREDRIREPSPAEVRPLLVATLFELSSLPDRPVALFGHSGGALLAHELAVAMARELASRCLHLFVSGQPAPHLQRAGPALHGLDDAELERAVRELGGTPEAVWQDPDLRALVLPALRADFRLWESLSGSDGAPLDVPITAYGGRDDPRVRESELAAWRECTSSTFAVRLFDGGHFYLDTALDDLIADVVSRLR